MTKKEILSEAGYERISRLLQELIRTDTCQPDGNEKRLVQKIENIFRDRALCSRIRHGDNRESLIVKVEGLSDRGGLVFCGHLDTVACQDKDAWTVPPFSGYRQDDLVYGRGAADMKGGVTAMILTAEYLIQNETKPVKPVYFCFTADEENAGEGAQETARHPWLQDIDELVVCEPTGGRIGCAEKGALWVRISMHGKSAHGSSPEKGVNALLYLMKMCSAVETSVKADGVSVSLTMLKGGEASNIIPGYAEAVLDIRTVPGRADHRELICTIQAEMEAFTRGIEGLTAGLEILNSRPALKTDLQSETVKRMMQVLKRHGKNAETIGISYYTDASLLVPEWKVPFLVIGPGAINRMHCADECVSVKEIQDMTNIYIEYAELFWRK